MITGAGGREKGKTRKKVIPFIELERQHVWLCAGKAPGAAVAVLPVCAENRLPGKKNVKYKESLAHISGLNEGKKISKK